MLVASFAVNQIGGFLLLCETFKKLSESYNSQDTLAVYCRFYGLVYMSSQFEHARLIDCTHVQTISRHPLIGGFQIGINEQWERKNVIQLN